MVWQPVTVCTSVHDKAVNGECSQKGWKWLSGLDGAWDGRAAKDDGGEEGELDAVWSAGVDAVASDEILAMLISSQCASELQLAHQKADGNASSNGWDGTSADISHDAANGSQCAEDDRWSLRSLNTTLEILKRTN